MLILKNVYIRNNIMNVIKNKKRNFNIENIILICSMYVFNSVLRKRSHRTNLEILNSPKFSIVLNYNF